MKAISLWQPHASWVAMGWKTIETRTHDRFKSLAGRRIAVHAAQKVDTAALLLEAFKRRMTSSLELETFMSWMMFCRGKIVCTAVASIVLWDSEVSKTVMRAELDRAAMHSTEGKYLMFLDRIEPMRKPVPYRGLHSIFEWSGGCE